MTVPTLSPKRLAITGASGLLGRALCAAAGAAGDATLALRNAHPAEGAGVTDVALDLSDLNALRRIIADFRPDAVIHAAALTSVDACEKDEDWARFLAADVATALIEATAEKRARLLYVSTDQLWDGVSSMTPEAAPPQPINAYGRSKQAGEAATLAAGARAVVVRTNFFGDGPARRRSFSDWIADALDAGRPIQGFVDSHFTPIALAHLAPAMRRVIDRRIDGVLHMAGGERISKYEFARRVAERHGFDPAGIAPARMADAGLAARRPPDMSLATARFARLLGRPAPSVADGLQTLRRRGPRTAADSEPKAHV